MEHVRICKEAVSACANHDYMVGYASALSGVEGQICAAPAVDAEPVRHGRWVHLGGDEWCCTQCGEVIYTEGSWEKPTKKICNECGAKMDGDDYAAD